MERGDVYEQYVKTRAFLKLDKRLAADIEDIVSAVAEYQADLPEKETKIALKRLSNALTAIEEMLLNANYLSDGTNVVNLRGKIDEYIEDLGDF